MRVAKDGKLKLDPVGFCACALVVIVGILLGAVRIPLSGEGLSGTSISLTNTGGVMIAGMVFGHFGHIEPLSFRILRMILSEEKCTNRARKIFQTIVVYDIICSRKNDNVILFAEGGK